MVIGVVLGLAAIHRFLWSRLIVGVIEPRPEGVVDADTFWRAWCALEDVGDQAIRFLWSRLRVGALRDRQATGG